MAKGFLKGTCSINNGETTVTLSGAIDASYVSSGAAIFIGDFPPVEGISGTIGSLELKDAWSNVDQTSVPFTVIYTIEGLRNAVENSKQVSDTMLAIVGSHEELLTSITPTVTIPINGVQTNFTPYQYLVDQFQTLIGFNDAGTVLTNADASNVGKSTFSGASLGTKIAGFFRDGANSKGIINFGRGSNLACQFKMDANTSSILKITAEHFNSGTGVSYTGEKELYHTGNTGMVSFGSPRPIAGAKKEIVFSPSNGEANEIDLSTTLSTGATQMRFYNPNGIVGSIGTNGSATSFSTSCDPRLKSDFTPFTAEESWGKFDEILACSGKFNFLADPSKEVWGFNAHMAVDSSLDFGSEGDGSRELELGEVYDTTPAVMGERDVLDDDDVATGNTEEYEITPAIEHKVSPVGVDQSKIVPYLVGVIDDLRNRDEAKTLLITDLVARLEILENK